MTSTAPPGGAHIDKPAFEGPDLATVEGRREAWRVIGFGIIAAALETWLAVALIRTGHIDGAAAALGGIALLGTQWGIVRAIARRVPRWRVGKFRPGRLAMSYGVLALLAGVIAAVDLHTGMSVLAGSLLYGVALFVVLVPVAALAMLIAAYGQQVEEK